MDPAESKKPHWELGITVLMFVGKDDESPRPPSQEASPDTAVLDFLSVIADKTLTEKQVHGVVTH